MTRWVVHCPAKVNLGLRVVGRRADGFHEIVTVFQTIDLWDRLEAVEAPELALSVDSAGVPSDERNLVLRAARRLQGESEGARRRGASLRLSKSIPAGGGLGGGSADAAGALVLLNRLWGLDFEGERLESLAAELGSDVAFFLRGGTALGSGRGERLEPLPPLPERALVLGIPPFPLATAEVYGALRAPLTRPGADVTVTRFFVNLAERNDFARVTNDLEIPAFALRPELVSFRDGLVSQGAAPALLSGSGSTVFGVFGSEAEAASAASRLRDGFPDWTLRTSRTVGARLRVETIEDEGSKRGSSPPAS